MKLRKRFEFDNTQRQVFSREIDLKRAKFRLAPRVLARIVVGAAPLLLMAFAALYFEQPHMFWFSLMFAFGVVRWQVLVFGFTGESSIAEMKATNFYSKGTLIFLAIFWTVLILGVAVALYLKFPN
jgi:hypothetical protein